MQDHEDLPENMLQENEGEKMFEPENETKERPDTNYEMFDID